MNRFARVSLVVAAILLLMVGTVYAWRGYTNRKKLQALLATATMRPEGQRPDPEAFKARREELNALPEAYRKEYFASRRDQFMSNEMKRMTAFFQLSKEEQRKQLDEEIARDEKRRKERDEERKKREAQAKASGTSGSSGNGNSSGRNGGSGTGSQGGGPPGGGGPGGWGGRGGLASRLDNTTPEFRATMAAYREAVAQRRQQLGLPPKPPRRSFL